MNERVPIPAGWSKAQPGKLCQHRDKWPDGVVDCRAPAFAFGRVLLSPDCEITQHACAEHVAEMSAPTFEQALSGATAALGVLGTGALRETLVTEGPRTYAVSAPPAVPAVSAALAAPVGGPTTAWPIRDVFARLSVAVDHLLAAHDCDCHGHEEAAAARDAARMILAAPAAPPAATFEQTTPGAKDALGVLGMYAVPPEQPSGNAGRLGEGPRCACTSMDATSASCVGKCDAHENTPVHCNAFDAEHVDGACPRIKAAVLAGLPLDSRDAHIAELEARVVAFEAERAARLGPPTWESFGREAAALSTRYVGVAVVLTIGAEVINDAAAEAGVFEFGRGFSSNNHTSAIELLTQELVDHLAKERDNAIARRGRH